MPHSPVGICKRECKEIFPQFFIFTVKRDIRFFRPFTEGIWRHDMYVGVGSWAKSSAATESMSEQCTGWHHPINHLSTLQRGCSPAFWLLTFRKTLEEEGTTKVLFLDLLGADAQTSVPPCSWLPSFLSSSALYICGRSWSFFILCSGPILSSCAAQPEPPLFISHSPCTCSFCTCYALYHHFPEHSLHPWPPEKHPQLNLQLWKTHPDMSQEHLQS